MDRPVTRYEFEVHKNQVRDDIHGLDQNIDHVRQELQQVKDSINELKYNSMKFVIGILTSFITGNGVIAIILKALGKL
jgi:Mg2+ and Co2+ transporter CorA